MCKEDLGLGRGRYAGQTVRTTISKAPLLAPNNNRVAILWSWTGFGTFTSAGAPFQADGALLFASIELSGTVILQLGPQSVVGIMRIEDLGQLVTGPFSLSMSGPTGQASFCMTEILSQVEQQPITK